MHQVGDSVTAVDDMFSKRGPTHKTIVRDPPVPVPCIAAEGKSGLVVDLSRASPILLETYKQSV